MNNNQNPLGIQLPISRDPVVATSLSVIPGLGQIYNLEPRKGVLFFLVGFTNLILIGTLAWSENLVNALKSVGTEYNIMPNSDIAHALSGYHAGSPSLTILFLLFAAFIAYAMRDAHDRASVVRRNTIYANSAMHISEASSGSYLFHAALMTTLVLFAFFFLIPTPPKTQVIDITFFNPTQETPKPQKTKDKAHINAEPKHNPNLKREVRNPAENSPGGAQPKQPSKSATKPAEAKPLPAKPTETKPAESKKADPKPTPTKAAANNPAPPKPAEQTPAKPNIAPVAPSHSTSAPTPNPLQPPTPLKAVPPTPTLGQPNSTARSLLDPTKLLANLTPSGAPTASAQLPQTQKVEVKSGGAPKLVASNIAVPTGSLPKPDFAPSSSRLTGPFTPKLVETGSREGKDKRGESNNRDSTGPRPSKGREHGPSDRGTDKTGSDVDDFAGLKPSLPPGEDGKLTGRKAQSEPGNPREKGLIGPPQKRTEEINFGPYMAELQRRIKRHWLPPSDPQSKRVTARFTISSNGALSNLRLSIPSGSSIADQAALKAISNTAPFPPLPEGSPESVDIEFKFDYNVFKNTGSVRPW
jgi:TonB family protein